MFLLVISDLLFLMFIFGNLKQHIIISVTYASQIFESGNTMKTCKELTAKWLVFSQRQECSSSQANVMMKTE